MTAAEPTASRKIQDFRFTVRPESHRPEDDPAAPTDRAGRGRLDRAKTADLIEIKAYAKLNLYLEILGRRADDYHDLESLMVTVDLHDTLTFEPDPAGRIEFICDDATLPTGVENLVVRAAQLLRNSSGTDQGARITLRKVIPAQAGLAGGSSDAAATLKGLDQLWGLRMGLEDFEGLSSQLGSDVCFFHHAPCALCRGRGELVEPMPLPGPLHFVLVHPPVGVQTGRVFRNLIPPDRPRSIRRIIEALASGSTEALGREFFNRLQPVAESLVPSLAAISETLASLSPSLDGHLMSGSGSTYFGLARDRDAAEDAASCLGSLGLGRVRVVTCGP